MQNTEDKNENFPQWVSTNDFIPYSSENLKRLLAQSGLTQKKFANSIGFSEPVVSDYCKGKRFPTIDFLLAVKNKFGICIDDFITKSINVTELPDDFISSKIEQNERKAYQKYCGSYFLYYLDSSKYKGRDHNREKAALVYGVMYIYESVTPLEKCDYSCITVMGIRERCQVIDLKNEIDSLANSSEVEKYITSMYQAKAYYGQCELTTDHVFLSLSHEDKDRALAIFHRVPINKPIYKGGIGTINSVTKGREPMPVVQFLGTSREGLVLSDEEIHHQLLLNYSTIKTTTESENLVKLFKSLYMPSSEGPYQLSEPQKLTTIKAFLERCIKESTERNMFRYGKVSGRDDDEWYHAIKEIENLDQYDAFDSL